MEILKCDYIKQMIIKLNIMVKLQWSFSGQPSSGGRLLPYVPQRYGVPPGRTLSEGRRWARARGVSFKDDLEDLDESGVDVLDGAATSREEEEEDDLLDDLPPPGIGQSWSQSY